MYKQPILLFGIVLPLLGMIAAIGGVYFLKSYMTDSFAVKNQQYRIYTQSRDAAFAIEGRISRQRPHLGRWKEELSTETTSAFRTHLKEIIDQLPSKEFQETGFEPLAGMGGFGGASAQKSSQIRLGFRGTFRAAERALLNLETRMPQLQAQELKIEPSTQSTLLNFQVTYTAWEN